MSIRIFTSLFFITVAGLFASLAIRDYVKGGGRPGPARKTWLLISILFTIVSVALIIS
jgi:hypothetical protein